VPSARYAEHLTSLCAIGAILHLGDSPNFTAACRNFTCCNGREKMSFIVDTSKPWDIESEEGLTVFEINKNLLLTSN